MSDEQKDESDVTARRLADESFRHSWDMSDERRINGAWVSGLCCECGEFVPFGQEVGHIADALAPLIREAQERAWREGHMTYRRLGPDDCECEAWNESECGCGRYGSNVITPNPYSVTPREADDNEHEEPT